MTTMTTQPHQDRVYIELGELADFKIKTENRLSSLEMFLKTSDFDDLDTLDKSQLIAQRGEMVRVLDAIADYLGTLADRAAAFRPLGGEDEAQGVLPDSGS